jgi:O-antigen/teichoic acid export membrane protein
VGGIVGTRGLGAVQGTVLLVRPFGTFQVAAIAAGVSEISRAADDHPGVRRHAVRTTTLATTLAVINGVILVVLPDRLGVIVLGATWHATKHLLLPTALQILCLGVLTGARAGMLGMRLIRRAMYIDVAGTVMFLTASIAGAIAAGTSGALWAVAASQAVLAGTWWLVFVRSTGGSSPAPDAPAGDGEVAAVAAVTASPPLF